ncbi:MAG: major capsid protein [Wigfec virus K19_152]|nr:MAG: major capsid protein [Wigfec virus K19_152]
MSHNLFNDVIYNNVPMNTFDLSHNRKFSFNMGRLTPILTQEVVPGDTFNVNQEQLIRMAPMVSPVMHRVNVSTHFFFVPNRLLWEGWEDFITNPLDPSNPAPFIANTGVQDREIKVGSLADYLGYPTGKIKSRKLNVFPISAYYKIYDDYYRDQNLVPEELTALVDGNNNTNSNINTAFNEPPRKRCWEKDYFTSALPSPQKGEAVSVPLGTTANIDYVPTGKTYIKDYGGGQVVQGSLDTGVDVGGSVPITIPAGGPPGESVNIDNTENLIVDLTTATAVTIEDLRRATRLQEWLEINARGGNRYIENIQNHFGVKSSDARLQRAEYLGGGKSNISFSEVLQMSASDETTPQGNMAGHGINVGNTHGFSRTFEEHGFIIGIMSVMPDTAYLNPTPKWATRLDPLEYLWPKFAQLGEQKVYNYEVDGEYPDADAYDVFGYQSRYADYKYTHSTVHGDMKTSLDFWHMARGFEFHNPVLNSEFVEANPTHRIFAVEDENEHKLYCVLFNRIKARRALPRYNIPTL